jgi:hypothetical protein
VRRTSVDLDIQAQLPIIGSCARLAGPDDRPGRSTRFGPVPAGLKLRRRNRFLLQSGPAPWGVPVVMTRKAPAGAGTWDGPGTAGACAERNPPLPLNATGADRSVNRAVTCRYVHRSSSEHGCRREFSAPPGRLRTRASAPRFRASRVQAPKVTRRGRRWHRVPGRPLPSAGRPGRCPCPAPAGVVCGHADRCSRTAPGRRQPGP